MEDRTFYGSVQKVIDGRTLKIWFDLGFNVSKTETVKLNRIWIRSLGTAGQKNPAEEFLENSVLNKNVRLKVFKKTDRYGDTYFAEVYARPLDLALSLKDINRTLQDNGFNGMININDLMVSRGVADRPESRAEYRNGRTSSPLPAPISPSLAQAPSPPSPDTTTAGLNP